VYKGTSIAGEGYREDCRELINQRVCARIQKMCVASSYTQSEKIVKV